MNTRLVGREPVMTVSTVVALLIAVLPVFGWSTAVVGTVSAALVVIGGAVEAALVSVDRLLPLLVGVAKAVLAAVVTFGVQVPGNWVAALMAVLTVIAGLATRAQVGAVQPPVDRQGREVDHHGWPVGELDTTRPDDESTYDVKDAPPLPDRNATDYTEHDLGEQHPRHGGAYGSRFGTLRPTDGM